MNILLLHDNHTIEVKKKTLFTTLIVDGTEQKQESLLSLKNELKGSATNPDGSVDIITAKLVDGIPNKYTIYYNDVVVFNLEF